MTQILNPWAIRGAVLVHADQAERSPDYTCPSCQEKMVLKAGEVRSRHFSHLPGSLATCTPESQEHFAAKHLVAQILRDGKNHHLVMLPCRGCNVLQRGQFDLIRIAEAFTERRLPTGHVGDVAGYGAEQELLLVVEILWSHKVPSDKIECLQDAGIPWIELDASAVLKDPNIWIAKRCSDRPLCLRCSAPPSPLPREPERAPAEPSYEGFWVEYPAGPLGGPYEVWEPDWPDGRLREHLLALGDAENGRVVPE